MGHLELSRSDGVSLLCTDNYLETPELKQRSKSQPRGAGAGQPCALPGPRKASFTQIFTLAENDFHFSSPLACELKVSRRLRGGKGKGGESRTGELRAPAAPSC